MAIEILFEDFKPLIEYKIAYINRFMCNEEFAVAFIMPEREELFEKLLQVVEKALRNTDIFSVKDGKLFLILSGTPIDGVDFIATAIRDFFRKEVAQVYVSFPLDGSDAESLLKNLIDKVERRYAISLESLFF